MRPDIEKIAKQHGFNLERRKKHRVYKRPEVEGGGTLVTSSTPSTQDWEQNALTDFAKVLGVPRKELLHVDNLPKRALRPHKTLARHQNPLPRTEEMVRSSAQLMAFINEHMRRTIYSMMFLSSYVSSDKERFDANAEAVMAMARNIRRDAAHAPVTVYCDAVFAMKIGGNGDGYDLVELRIPLEEGGTFVLYLDPAEGGIHLDVPWTVKDGGSYEPVAYAGDWFMEAV